MKMKWRGVLLLAAILISASHTAYASEQTEKGAEQTESTAGKTKTDEKKQYQIGINRIVPGVLIGTVDVGGMTKKEATAAVKAYMKDYTGKTVTLDVKGQSAYTTVAKLGYAWSNEDVVDEAMQVAKQGNIISRYKERVEIQEAKKKFSIETALDEEKMKKEVDAVCAPYDNPAKNATVKKEGSGFAITEGQDGYLVDRDATSALVKEELNGWNGKEFAVNAVCVTDKPKVTSEDCKKIGEKPMGSYSTYFGTGSANYNRNMNIQNGCRLLNGITLAPDEQLSVLDAIMPFSVENGFYEAGTFEGGRVSTGIGGGICQVSTTLYNALLLAELQIDVRYNHSMTVGYVPLAADAAISEGYKDLVFTNNTDAPLYIEAYANLDTGVVTFNLYGHDTRDPGRTVEYKSQTISKTPPGYREILDKSKPAGYKRTTTVGYTGYVAKLWKYVYQDGKQISKEEVNTSTYIATDTEVVVGPKK